MDKILIVEVSKSLAFALKSTFEESDDISCFICHNMAEVKALINDHIDFSIALINLQLPDAPDGEIINLLNVYDIPIVILTGSDDIKIRRLMHQKAS